MKGPDCYQCIHRRASQFTAHSACHHPKIRKVENIGKLMMSWLQCANRLGVESVECEPEPGLRVKGSAHGIRNGWFGHPLDFDPVWLEGCSVFEPKKEEANGPPSDQGQEIQE